MSPIVLVYPVCHGAYLPRIPVLILTHVYGCSLRGITEDMKDIENTNDMLEAIQDSIDKLEGIKKKLREPGSKQEGKREFQDLKDDPTVFVSRAFTRTSS
jgi:hypothetical protein